MSQPESGVGKRIGEEIRRLMEGGTPVCDNSRVSTDKADPMIIQRKVRAYKGKWTRFPPEVINRQKNEKGESGI
jgi:hypothetical protein